MTTVAFVGAMLMDVSVTCIPAPLKQQPVFRSPHYLEWSALLFAFRWSTV